METLAKTSVTPSKEMLEFAIEKASKIEANSQIRLTADHNSYYLFNVGGKLFIGVDPKEESRPFFKSRPLMTMKNKEGEIIYRDLQRLV